MKNINFLKKILLLACLFFNVSIFAFFPCNYKKNAFVSLQYRYYQTDHFWNKNGKRLDAYNHFKEQSAGLYFEYILSKRDLLSLEGWYDKINESVNGRTFGFEDPELSWTHLLWKDNKHYFSSRLTAIIPSGPKKTNLRYGRFGGEFDFIYSNLFCYFNRPGYYNILLGYRGYQGFPSDQIRNIFNVGFSPTKWLVLNLESRLEYGLFNGKKDKNRNTILFNSNYRLLKLKIETIFFVHRFTSLVASYYRHVWGENVGAGGGFTAGANFHF